MTDVLATWIKKRICCTTPLTSHISRTLEETQSWQQIKNQGPTILSLSFPNRASFNDAVNIREVDDLKMCFPKLFTKSIIKTGMGALLSKTDIQAVLRIRIQDPVLFDTWIRDPG
jgi:hypothetical protein